MSEKGLSLSYHCSSGFVSPQCIWTEQVYQNLSAHLEKNIAANPNPLSRSEQPQAVQSTSGWVTYSKGLTAHRQQRSPNWPLTPIRTALEEKGNKTESLKTQYCSVFCMVWTMLTWECNQLNNSQVLCFATIMRQITLSYAIKADTYAKGTSTESSRGWDAGHGRTHAWYSTGEQTQSVEIQAWNEVGLELPNKKYPTCLLIQESFVIEPVNINDH